MRAWIKRKIAAVARDVFTEEQAKAQPARKSRGYGAYSAQKAGADLIREVLPTIFQRTHGDLKPTGNPGGASMDAALDTVNALPDVYAVQDTVPAVVMSWYGAQSFISHQACAILAQHWLIGKACAMPAEDAVQNGFMPVIQDADSPAPELQAELAELNKQAGILGQCKELVRNSRIFGIRHALFLVDGIDYTAPFNIDGVTPGSYKGISQIDPYWLTPEFSTDAIRDPSNLHFYEPTWWRLPGGQRVHRSHFVILRQQEVPDVLKPTYYYGGVPLTQRLYERVYAAERTANEAPELAVTKRLTVMQGDVDNYITDENAVTERLHAFNRLRSNFGFLVTGENESITQSDTSLADFDALIMTQYQLVASIAGVPATELLGTTPKGFNSTGENERDSYDQDLVSIQTDGMTPLTDRHHLLLVRSHLAPKYGPMRIVTQWNPVRAPKPGEKADLNLKKAQTGQALVTSGALQPEEERARVSADPDSGYSNIAAAPGAGAEDTTAPDVPAWDLDSEGGGNGE